jgi:hypothetical protein
MTSGLGYLYLYISWILVKVLRAQTHRPVVLPEVVDRRSPLERADRGNMF